MLISFLDILKVKHIQLLLSNRMSTFSNEICRGDTSVFFVKKLHMLKK